jgi:hypothetical protein
MMKKQLAGLIFFISVSLLASGGNGEYAVSRIPAALLKNAHAVKRAEQISFEVINTGEAVLRKKYAITILDENGERFASFEEYYDKLHEIRNVEGSLYDADGKELKRLKNKQIIDMTGSDGDNLVDENRVKFHKFYYRVYPYTVEYEVDIKYNGTLFFPIWMPNEGEHFSVEQSSISIITPPGYEIRSRAFNYTGKAVITEGEKGRKIQTWQTSGLSAIEDEYASPNWYEMNTVIFFGPTAFEIEKYQGNMNSWQDFGRFVYSLKQGRDQLPDNIKQVVHQLTDNISDKKEKIARLYEYLQKNTRYISIQLGIGGWQPFDAKYVAAKAYGDCKALTNYMYSLLREAGVNSIYTLVKAGRRANKVIPDFPSQQFNHVILCVPLQKDTVWLECTSQTLPPGYLGSGTNDRYALLVMEDGGKLIRTPRYGLKENLELRKIKATLTEEATLQVKAETTYGGLQQDLYHELIHSLTKDKVKEFLHEQLNFATYDVRSFDYKETMAALPAVLETLEIEVLNYATITGKRLFIVPNIMTRHGRKLSADSTRKYDIEILTEYHDVDTVEIALPAGYNAESLPKDVTISTKFGKYACSVRLIGSSLFYYRSMEHFSGLFPARDYSELVGFYESVYKADRNKVVLVKNETAPRGF